MDIHESSYTHVAQLGVFCNRLDSNRSRGQGFFSAPEVSQDPGQVQAVERVILRQGDRSRWSRKGLTRRDFLTGSVAGGILGLSGAALLRRMRQQTAETFIAKVPDYLSDITGAILSGMKELGVTEEEVKGKRILLKPNYVEIRAGAEHINTHPEVIRGAAEAFRRLGAAEVLVGEGSGHERDTLMILENTGLGDILQRERISFVDLNNDSFFTVPNTGKFRRLKTLTFPNLLRRVDMVVSVAKMKTHHWAGVTLAMKNLFGIMPGIVYGWPKNVLHHAGIGPSILDINATVRPHFAIVDGIVGMEGDGPIMGTPKKAGVVVMGRNPLAVDATCTRVMGIDPGSVDYFSVAEGWLGPIDPRSIDQRGEAWAPVASPFKLVKEIEAQARLQRL